MGKIRLEIEYDYDFILFGICSHDKDYRLCWAINQKLGMDFSRSEPIVIADKKKNKRTEFPVYHFAEEEIFTDFYIIANKSAGTVLVPEQKQADYFLMVKGNLTDEEKEGTLKRIRETQNVLTAFEIDPASLRSRQYFQF
ncbi:MAG: IPExxxVDY family protein [Bacteroidota bacterium]